MRPLIFGLATVTQNPQKFAWLINFPGAPQTGSSEYQIFMLLWKVKKQSKKAQ